MSVRYGQKLTVDDEGWWTQGIGITAVSALGIGFSMLGGMIAGKRTVGGIVGGLALMGVAGIFMAFTVTNSTGYTGYQVLSKVRPAENRKKAAEDVAAIQNKNTLDERKELRSELFRTYVATKSKDGKEDALARIEALTSKPVKVQVPQGTADDVPDARAEVVHSLLGVDGEKARALSIAMLPVLLVVGEVLGSFLGTALWPARVVDEPQDFPETFPKLSKAEAKSNLIEMQKQGIGLGVTEYAEKWGVPDGTASRWIKDFAREGLTRQSQKGRRKVCMPPRPNGLHVVA